MVEDGPSRDSPTWPGGRGHDEDDVDDDNRGTSRDDRGGGHNASVVRCTGSSAYSRVGSDADKEITPKWLIKRPFSPLFLPIAHEKSSIHLSGTGVIDTYQLVGGRSLHYAKIKIVR